MLYLIDHDNDIDSLSGDGYYYRSVVVIIEQFAESIYHRQLNLQYYVLQVIIRVFMTKLVVNLLIRVDAHHQSIVHMHRSIDLNIWLNRAQFAKSYIAFFW